MTVKSYNPADVVLMIGGIKVGGFAKGTFITCGRDNPTWAKGKGSDGEGWRAKSNDKSGTCTITTLGSSASNDLLSALAILDEASGDGVVPFLLKDNSGTTLFSGESCWVEKPADAEFADSMTDREWPISIDELNVFVGGNSTSG